MRTRNDTQMILSNAYTDGKHYIILFFSISIREFNPGRNNYGRRKVLRIYVYIRIQYNDYGVCSAPSPGRVRGKIKIGALVAYNIHAHVLNVYMGVYAYVYVRRFPGTGREIDRYTCI